VWRLQKDGSYKLEIDTYNSKDQKLKTPQ
jgi:hypothetical protein